VKGGTKGNAGFLSPLALPAEGKVRRASEPEQVT
jgi:hypothetical protein